MQNLLKNQAWTTSNAVALAIDHSALDEEIVLHGPRSSTIFKNIYVSFGRSCD